MTSNLKEEIIDLIRKLPEDATIDDISKNTGITLRDVQAIVLDLKASGLLRGKFSSSTGAMTNVDVVKP